MKPSRPTVVFDLDGTLADTIHDLASAVNVAIASENLAPITAAQIRGVGGDGIKAMLHRAYALNNQVLDDHKMPELFNLCLAEYTQHYCRETVLFAGAEEALNQFSAHGWNLAICTNKHVGLATKLLEALGGSDRFAAISGGNSYPYKKPDARHLLQTIDEAGGNSDNALMVGDTQVDIKSAQNANIPVIAVDFGYSKEPVANFSPDHVISHFDELFEIAQRLVPNP